MASSTAQQAHSKAYRNAEAIEKLEERVARLEQLLSELPSDGIKSATPAPLTPGPTGIIGDPV